MLTVVRIGLFVLEYFIYFFIVLFLCYKKYQRNKSLKNSSVYFVLCAIINILIFITACQNCIFLSYPKMILIAIVIFIEIGIWLADYWQDSHTIIAFIIGMTSMASLIFLVGCGEELISGWFQKCSETTITEKIIPQINGKNGVGYIYDENESIVGYMFEYSKYEKKYYVEIDSNNANIIGINDNSESYVMKDTIYKTYTNDEKKVKFKTAEDYYYVIFVNSSQIIKYHNGR